MLETKLIFGLTEALKRVQDAEGLTTPKMAQRLGISWKMLQFIYLGERKPGRKVLTAILRRYPGMASLILENLRG